MMKLWRKRVVLFLLSLLVLTIGAAAAEHHGYIIRLEPQVSLLGEDVSLPEGVEAIYAPEQLYRTDDEALIAQLEEAGLLIYAEPDYPVELMEVPDDPGWTEGKQWDLETIGLPYAWNRGIDGQAADGTRIRIGIVDSGVYAEHQDLKNAHFVPGVNILAEEGTEERSLTPDTYGHGTFVTGIIAAEANNGIGTAGIAPGAEIMPIKCFDGKTSSMSALIKGIYAGVDGGCRILNLSLGVSAGVLQFQALTDTIAYAAERDVIVVAAVGNNLKGSTGNDPLLYPAAFDSVIGVGSVAASGTIASHSYQNESVFITAPGSGLYGLGIAADDKYVSGGGTSYATAEVTAAVALALSVDPGMTPETVMALLRKSAEDCGDEGYDTCYGYGRLDLERLLTLLHNGCYTVNTPEGEMAVIRAEGLTPGSIASAIRVIYDENGAQEAFLLTALTVGEDGTLKEQLELPREGRVSLMLLDDSWTPVIDSWSGIVAPEDGEGEEDPELPPENPGSPEDPDGGDDGDPGEGENGKTDSTPEGETPENGNGGEPGTGGEEETVSEESSI